MCRIAFIPPKELKQQPPKRMEGILAGFFAYLEKANGGHGNGVAIVKNGQITIRKGAHLTVEEAAKFAVKSESWVLFHTRLVSRGLRSDRQSHPFALEYNGHTWGALAHNGDVNPDFIKEARYVLGITDKLPDAHTDALTRALSTWNDTYDTSDTEMMAEDISRFYSEIKRKPLFRQIDNYLSELSPGVVIIATKKVAIAYRYGGFAWTKVKLPYGIKIYASQGWSASYRRPWANLDNDQRPLVLWIKRPVNRGGEKHA